jgi:hypothetical protein
MGLLELQSRLDSELVARVEDALDALALDALAVQLPRKIWIRDVFHAHRDIQDDSFPFFSDLPPRKVLAIASTLPE